MGHLTAEEIGVIGVSLLKGFKISQISLYLNRYVSAILGADTCSNLIYVN